MIQQKERMPSQRCPQPPFWFGLLLLVPGCNAGTESVEETRARAHDVFVAEELALSSGAPDALDAYRFSDNACLADVTLRSRSTALVRDGVLTSTSIVRLEVQVDTVLWNTRPTGGLRGVIPGRTIRITARSAELRTRLQGLEPGSRMRVVLTGGILGDSPELLALESS